MKYWGGSCRRHENSRGGPGAFPRGKFLKLGPGNSICSILRTHFVKNLGFPNIVIVIVIMKSMNLDKVLDRWVNKKSRVVSFH